MLATMALWCGSPKAKVLSTGRRPDLDPCYGFTENVYLLYFDCLGWLLLMPPACLDSGVWEKYFDVRCYLTRYLRGNSKFHSSEIIHNIRSVSKWTYRIAYFFFDFKDTAKQDARALLSSLLVQLCDQSNASFKRLFDIYSTHNNGTQQPSLGALTQCLKNLLRGLGQVPVYLIVDALDECPNTSKAPGVPSSRQRVLEAIKELVKLRFSNLHICVTSRDEFDIRNALKQLAYFKVSLHDQDGQKENVVKYVTSVVYSDGESMMKKWRTEEKELVIETLSKKQAECRSINICSRHMLMLLARFLWVACQLETLRHCFTRNVRPVLSELPKSLDETYERVLKNINESNKEDAYRLLQCLTVAMRPLRVEELAEVLAIDFDDAQGLPRMNPDWQWEDQEEALQAASSSLISIVDIYGSRVVQFSHCSVKEFLTSRRLAELSSDVSCYYISSESAHTVLAQACLGVLLWLDHRFNMYIVWNDLPLADHAAEY
jgi:hypothetical protein